MDYPGAYSRSALTEEWVEALRDDRRTCVSIVVRNVIMQCFGSQRLGRLREPNGHCSHPSALDIVNNGILGNCSQYDASNFMVDRRNASVVHCWYTPFCAGCGLSWALSSVVAPEVSQFVNWVVMVLGQGDRSSVQMLCFGRLQELGKIVLTLQFSRDALAILDYCEGGPSSNNKKWLAINIADSHIADTIQVRCLYQLPAAAVQLRWQGDHMRIWCYYRGQNIALSGQHRHRDGQPGELLFILYSVGSGYLCCITELFRYDALYKSLSHTFLRQRRFFAA